MAAPFKAHACTTQLHGAFCQDGDTAPIYDLDAHNDDWVSDDSLMTRREFPKPGGPKIDPNMLSSFLQGLSKRGPVFWRPPDEPEAWGQSSTPQCASLGDLSVSIRWYQGYLRGVGADGARMC